jgi:hypothetical protein
MGRFDQKDATIIYNKILTILQFNLPAGGGFAAGFVGGLKIWISKRGKRRRNEQRSYPTGNVFDNSRRHA